MKKVLLLVIFMFVNLGFSQDSLKVAKDDWNYVKQTTLEIDSALTECESLNDLYGDRMSEFQLEVSDLRRANTLADSIIVQKDIQLVKRREQVTLLDEALRKQRVEIWAYRIGLTIIAIAGVLVGI